MPPGTQGIAQALRDSEALSQLTRRVRDSQARLAALQPLLPLALRSQVRAGPVDDEGYTLLVPNPAVAAKLRYLAPTLEQSLVDQGWPRLPVRIRMLSAR